MWSTFAPLMASARVTIATINRFAKASQLSIVLGAAIIAKMLVFVRTARHIRTVRAVAVRQLTVRGTLTMGVFQPAILQGVATGSVLFRRTRAVVRVQLIVRLACLFLMILMTRRSSTLRVGAP